MIMHHFVRIVIILFLLSAGAILTFIAQLYNHIIFWVISYALLLGSIAIGAWINRRSLRLIAALVFSIIINGNFLLHVPYGNPVLVMVFYALGLTLITWAILFSIAELTSGVMIRNRPIGN